MDKIVIKDAKAHNLKNTDIEIPKNKLVVSTGPSKILLGFWYNLRGRIKAL